MTIMRTLIILIVILNSGIKIVAQDLKPNENSEQENSGLINAIMLHPVDASTAYTLKKGEWAYNHNTIYFLIYKFNFFKQPFCIFVV